MFDCKEVSHVPSHVLQWLVSPLLFNLPAHYLDDLAEVWVDGVVKYHPWKTFIIKLQRDWEISITPVRSIYLSTIRVT